MSYPEYLEMFSNTGDIDVTVKFDNKQGFVNSQRMTAEEVVTLVDRERQGFHHVMRFDEHPFEVYKYEIDPLKNKLMIKVRSPK